MKKPILPRWLSHSFSSALRRGLSAASGDARRSSVLPALAFLAVSLLTHVASAMSVAVPTFGELVTEAAAIVRAQVVSSSSHTSLSPDGKRLAYTSVTFTVLKTLKGDGEKTMTLTFLGGAADGVVTRVPGMPQFAVGETDFLFIGKNREAACPLIAGEFGRYKLRIDEEKARTDVPAATRYLKPAGESAAPTDEEFESAINSELTRSKS